MLIDSRDIYTLTIYALGATISTEMKNRIDENKFTIQCKPIGINVRVVGLFFWPIDTIARSEIYLVDPVK